MKKTMKVSLPNLAIGCVLAEDVRHLTGRLLIKKGTQIDEREFRILKMWGIPEIEIVAQPYQKANVFELQTTQFTSIRAKLKERFALVDMNSALAEEIYRLALEHLGEVSNNESDSNSLISASTDDFLPNAPLDKIKFADIKEHLENIQLPSLPNIVYKVFEALHNPRSSSTHIAHIISQDSALSARLLKLVNSAFYNFPVAIDSIGHAVTIIGSRQLSSLALSSSIIAAFDQIPRHIVDMNSFWRHSIATGLIARILGSYQRNINTEHFFLAGLLHDIGRLIFYQYFAPQMEQAIHTARIKKIPLYQAEEKIFQLDHGELGKILLEKWKLPAHFIAGTAQHHHFVETEHALTAATVHIADVLTNALELGSSGEYFVPPLQMEAWKTLSLPISVLESTIHQTETQIEETIRYFTHHD